MPAAELPLGNPPTTYYYNYFNITDAQISKDHTRDSLSAQLPVANGTRYSFNAYFGGNQYGSDFSGLDYSVPEYSYPDYSEPDYPDDDYGYIDDWSDDDWDNYWNDLDNRLNANGYDDIGKAQPAYSQNLQAYPRNERENLINWDHFFEQNRSSKQMSQNKKDGKCSVLLLCN